MNTGKRLTFLGLFDLVSFIEIPILQRDYAQGRVEAADIRSLFLSSLFEALTISSSTGHQPLDLDFVYGNFEGTENKVFSVLDGQQRLTTLFLLHWYLAFKNNRQEDFKTKFFTEDGRSRFSYKTRPSTSEFFNALTSVQFEYSQESISKRINNSQWFYLSWKQDPTVQSCLCMLDAIEEKFKDYEGDLYERLTVLDEPYITFQFLNLHSFGLSDELYIKMNARGKPLTAFENFKAWLFGKVENLSIKTEFEHKIDQQWTDLFWQLSVDDNVEFDEIYLRFFNLLAYYHSCERTEGSYTLLPYIEKSWITNLRVSKGYIPHSRLEQINAFEQKDISRIMKVLDYLSSTDQSKLIKLFLSVVKGTSHLSQIQFYAFILFIEKAPSIEDWSEETHTQLSRWLRVTRNLIHNHRIDDLASFIPSIKSLNQISEHCLSIYEAIIQDSFKEVGFTKDQWEEEKVKAQLIIADEKWDLVFKKYESHPYLKGKIGFILKLANVDGQYQREAFKRYADKTSILLSSEILTSSNCSLQRALLSIENYLIEDGYNRYSFGLPNSTTYRERSENWFKIVTKAAFKILLDKIIGSNCDEVLLELHEIINDDSTLGWRSLLIKYPEAIQYCSKRLIHRQGELVYLLSKTNRRGYHGELYSFVLNLQLKKLERNGQLPDEITLSAYEYVYGDETPKAQIKLNDKLMGICFKNGKYKITTKTPHSVYPSCFIDSEIETPSEVLDLLVSLEIDKEIIA